MKDGQAAGFAVMSGSDFGWVGVVQENGVRRIRWPGGEGPTIGGQAVWFRGINSGDAGRLLYSLDGETYVEAGDVFRLRFRFWKGARIAIFSYGPNGGAADFDYLRYAYGTSDDSHL